MVVPRGFFDFDENSNHLVTGSCLYPYVLWILLNPPTTEQPTIDH